MGSSMVDVKASGQTRWRFNAVHNQVQGVRILRFNGQDQIVRSVNYCCSSIWVVSIDENKNTATERLSRLTLKPLVQTASLFTRVKKGALPAEVGALAPVFEKSTTELKLKQKLLKCKRIIQTATFNFRILNRIGQLPELTASAIDHNIDIICTQEYRYIHCEDIKYYDTDNGWTLVIASA